jgi:hypothetical protein
MSIVAGLFLLLGAGLIWGASGLPEAVTLGEPGPARFPYLCGGIIIVLSVLLLARALRGGEGGTLAFPQWPRVAVVALAGLTYAALMPRLGYFPATAVFLFPVLLLLRARWPVALAVTVGFVVFIYLVFVRLLHVPLP